MSVFSSPRARFFHYTQPLLNNLKRTSEYRSLHTHMCLHVIYRRCPHRSNPRIFITVFNSIYIIRHYVQSRRQKFKAAFLRVLYCRGIVRNAWVNINHVFTNRTERSDESFSITAAPILTLYEKLRNDDTVHVISRIIKCISVCERACELTVCEQSEQLIILRIVI